MTHGNGRRAAIIPLRLTARLAQQRIRELAADTDNIRWGVHARERMSEREIFDVDVLRILRGGDVEENPSRTDYGEWRCKVVRMIRGGREAGVVTIILHDNKLFVKTVEWEDVR
jgi:hypothetical protein